jgi:hypothetical protein
LTTNENKQFGSLGRRTFGEISNPTINNKNAPRIGKLGDLFIRVKVQIAHGEMGGELLGQVPRLGRVHLHMQLELPAQTVVLKRHNLLGGCRYVRYGTSL